MIDRVKISKEFPGLWIGMESSVDPGTTPEQVLSEMYSKIGEWQKWLSVNQHTEVLPVITDETRDEVLKNLHKNNKY